MGHLLFNMFLNDIFFFLKDANLGSYAENSTMHAYNKNLETVIWNVRQKVSILYSYFYSSLIKLSGYVKVACVVNIIFFYELILL